MKIIDFGAKNQDYNPLRVTENDAIAVIPWENQSWSRHSILNIDMISHKNVWSAYTTVICVKYNFDNILLERKIVKLFS